MKVCEVRFKEAGRRYYFDALDYQLEEGMSVVVETIKGTELGLIVSYDKDIKEEELNGELKPIIRIATKEDIKEANYNKTLEQEVIETTKRLVKKNDLEMKILASEYTLYRDRLVIYFEAEGRVDFRQLVRDLNDVYNTRIELRQVGSRDGAKFIGGIGPCGLVTCCKTYIDTFDNVSIKMAKNQNLSLNPQKISGNCGKLLCCIKYENEVYEELKKTLPDVGDKVVTKDGVGKVIDVQIIKKQVRVLYSDGLAVTYSALDVKKDDR